jgi:hypothetical protein
MTMQLFLVVLGGRIEGCHIELHDVRFVVGTSIEDTLPQLRLISMPSTTACRSACWRAGMCT